MFKKEQRVGIFRMKLILKNMKILIIDSTGAGVVNQKIKIIQK